jgi:hypothetical protein
MSVKKVQTNNEGAPGCVSLLTAFILVILIMGAVILGVILANALNLI